MNDISLDIEFQSKAKGISMNPIKSPKHNEIKVTVDRVDDSDRVQECFFRAYPNHHEKFWNNHSMNSLLNIRMSSSQKKDELIRVRNNQISVRRSNCRVFLPVLSDSYFRLLLSADNDQLCQKSDALAPRKLLPLNV